MNTKVQNGNTTALKNLNWGNPIVYFVDGRQVYISDNYPNLNYKVITVDKPKQKSKNKKRVKFDLNNTKYINTYSNEEYDRSSIDSVVYLKTLQRISLEEWSNIFYELNHYKINEMPSHKDSVSNIRIHK